MSQQTTQTTIVTQTTVVSGSGDWQHGLCGCFDNLGVCIVTYLVPCYTFGKNSEAVGDNCLLCGIAYIFWPIDLIFGTLTRGKIRERRGIPGTVVKDFLYHFCCPCCALVQEAQEVRHMQGHAIVRE